MSFYTDEEDCSSFKMMQRVVCTYDGSLPMDTLFGALAHMIDDPDTGWYSAENKYHIHVRNRSRLAAAEYEDLYYSDKFHTKESDDERKDILQESKKSKGKAEKKRLKKQRQKERKRLEKKQNNPIQDKKDKDLTSQTKDEDKNDDKSKESVKDVASAQDSESSDDSSDESSNEDLESEELDLTSSFVTKAAQIAKRQLEQKPKQENKEKKKTPVKEIPKTRQTRKYKNTPEKPNDEGKHVEKKEATTSSNSKLEYNVKISTEFATIGNKFAMDGDFIMAVKYFTDAIRYNPIEYRLFGNRAFCFEKMQEYEKSLNDAEVCLSMCPGWVKGLFRKGRALAGLKRYEEAAGAFKEVLKVDSLCTEAAQELMRVQITQLMAYGFTQEQSSNALIIYGSVNKAQEVLSNLNNQPGVAQNGPVPPQQVATVTGISPVLSAKAAPASPHPPPAQETFKKLPENKPLVPVHTLQSQTKQDCNVTPKSHKVVQAPELFPVWVGSLSLSVTEDLIINLFNKVGTVYSVKHLPSRRCAFVNFTQQGFCDEAIRRYHGFDLMGSKLAVRYPDRIPPGMNISKSANKAHDLQHENLRTVGGRPFHPNFRGPYKY